MRKHQTSHIAANKLISKLHKGVNRKIISVNEIYTKSEVSIDFDFSMEQKSLSTFMAWRRIDRTYMKV